MTPIINFAAANSPCRRPARASGRRHRRHNAV